MARFAGRNGRVYLGIASDTAQASPLPFVAQWELNFSTPKPDVSAMGDAGKVTVSGLPEQSGSFSGFMDDATAQTYTAAVDGLPRRYYLYPIASDATKYFFGTINVDATFGAEVAGGGTFSANWEAATTIARVGV